MNKKQDNCLFHLYIYISHCILTSPSHSRIIVYMHSSVQVDIESCNHTYTVSNTTINTIFLGENQFRDFESNITSNV